MATSSNGQNTSAYEVIQNRYEFGVTTTKVVKGQEYTFKVSAVNGVGESEFSDGLMLFAMGLPPKPTNVQITPSAVDPTSAELSWDAPVSEDTIITGYVIFYGIQGSREPTNRYLWKGTATSTGFLTFASGQGLKFQVFAKTLNEMLGDGSDVLNWFSASLPGAPDFSLLGSAVGSLTFGWSAPKDTGGAYLFAYNIYVFEESISEQNSLRWSGLAFSQTIEGLKTGVPYTAVIKAQSVAGEGEGNSLPVQVCEVPPLVSDFKVVKRDRVSTTFTWLKPTVPLYCPIEGYALYAGLSVISFSLIGRVKGVDTTNFTYIHPVPDTPRYYKVITDNWRTLNFPSSVVGFSSSKILYAITAGAPGKVLNVEMTGVDLTQISLKWDTPAEDGGSPIIGYRIEKNDGKGGTTFIDALQGSLATTTTATVTGLFTGQEYKLRIAACSRTTQENALEDVKLVFSEEFARKLGRVPSKMDPPTEVGRTGSSISVQWTPPADIGGQVLLGYLLWRSDGSAGAAATILAANTSVATTDFTAGGLNPGAQYSFAVQVYNAIGISVVSDLLTLFIGLGPEVLEAPERDTSIKTSAVQMNLKWKAGDISKSNKPISMYKILRDDGFLGDFVEVGTTTLLNETVGSLKNSYYYRFVVQAYNEIGWGPYSPVYRSQTCGQPTNPHTLTLSDWSDEGAVLKWSMPTDGGCSHPTITQYEVFEKDNNKGKSEYVSIYKGGPSVFALNITGKQPRETYNYQIRVSNYDQTSDVWPPELVLTVGQPPGAVGLPQYVVGSGSPTGFMFSWALPYSPLPVLETRIYSDNADSTRTAIDYLIDADVAADQLNYTMTGLTPGSVHRIQIVSKNRNGWGLRSGITTLSASYDLLAPASLTYRNSTDDRGDGKPTVYVEWTPPPVQHANDAEITQYNIDYIVNMVDLSGNDLSLNNETVQGTFLVTPTTRFANATGISSDLALRDTISFRVQGCNVNTCGAFTAYLDLLVAGLPGSPGPPTVSETYDFSVDQKVPLSWPAANGTDGGSELTSYALYTAADTTDSTPLQDSDYTLTVYTASPSLTSYDFPCSGSLYQRFYVKVAGINGAGGNLSDITLGGFSTPVPIVCTGRPDTPPPPEALSSQDSIRVLVFDPTEQDLNYANHTGWEFYLRHGGYIKCILVRGTLCKGLLRRFVGLLGGGREGGPRKGEWVGMMIMASMSGR